jgi:hypothetical protein
MSSSGLRCSLDIAQADVSEERITSIFRVEENPRARNQREPVAALSSVVVNEETT